MVKYFNPTSLLDPELNDLFSEPIDVSADTCICMNVDVTVQQVKDKIVKVKVKFYKKNYLVKEV